MRAERISQIVEAIEQMDSLSEEAEILQTMLFSAQEMKIDSDGRMLLSAEFIEFAGLEETRCSPALAGLSRFGALISIKNARQISVNVPPNRAYHA